MKYQHVLLLVCLSITFVLVATAGKTNAVPGDKGLRQGPVGSYPLDGGAEDFSGNDYNGTMYGTTPVADRNGMSDSATEFDGIDDSITLPNVTAMFGTSPSGWSSSIWVNFSEDDAEEEAVMADYSSDAWDERFGLYVSRYPDGYVHAVVRKQHLEEWNCPTLAPVPIETWHMITFTVSMQSGVARLYLDGAPQSEQTIDTSVDYLDATPLYIGTVYWLGEFTHFLHGTVDDLRLYDRALEPAEVGDLFDGSDAVAYYPCDGNALDYSGNGHHGNVVDAIPCAGHHGDLDMAYAFDGLSAAITLPSAESEFGANPSGWTYSVWVRPYVASYPDNEAMIVTDYNSDGWDTRFGTFLSRRSDGHLYAVVRKAHLEEWECSTLNPVDADQWHQATVVVSRTAATLSLYLDGMLQSQAQIDGSVDYIEDVPIYIGKQFWLGEFVHYFPGEIDEVRFFDRALSDGEVTKMYMATDAVAYYPLDGNATDASTGGHHGALVGGTVVAGSDGAPDGAIEFGEPCEGITIEDNEAVIGLDPQDYSYGLSANADDAVYADNEVVLMTDYSSDAWDTRVGIFLSRRTDGHVYAMVRAAHMQEWECSTAEPVPTHEWHHFLVTVSRTHSRMRLYLDGVRQSEVTIDPTVNYVEASPIYIAQQYWLGGYTHFFPGALDNVQIWNRELGADEDVAVTNNDYPAGEIPTPDIRLGQNRPNPFNPRTTIAFSLPRLENVSLRIYDLRGELVKTLVAGPLSQGSHEYIWDGRSDLGANAASGTYVYRLDTTERVLSKSMVLIR